MKNTPREWCKIFGIQIIDPDGWRLPDSPSPDTEITKEDFRLRVGISTTQVIDRERWLNACKDD